ncbi:protein adenylyltransferase SelO [Reichenbachiella versicolor]|uniref:protein adenylyltransferase SelO n=1 Tax=Reichenbachiella versicolor TaxID=1821036 RepID=UPI000D6E0BAC|nr:YdiU family protein [Reichenbachiella versicolor]
MENNQENMWKLDNTYLEQLPKDFYQKQAPAPATNPEILLYNNELAKDLGLPSLNESKIEIQEVLSGSGVVPNSTPIAQAYAGHQFGNFTMLGDGRAVLLGEKVTESNERYDIQLKGSGQTPYSRRGDGRATLKSMLREYLISEAMHHLGISSTRSLAVTKTGLPVYREEVESGAVLTRIAKSHIRVGTFEYASFIAKQPQPLLDYAVQRHYPELVDSKSKAIDFLKSVMERQANLIVDWMRVGFIHGVMNTDNMSIAGETIDYGPCAFMNTYSPSTVFSSIDRTGRYAYANQPPIAQWNLGMLASALLPLIDEDKDKAIEQAQALIDEFPSMYNVRRDVAMYKKLGIVHVDESKDKALVDDLFDLMEKHSLDYTNFFISLRFDSLAEKLLKDEAFNEWYMRWSQAVDRKQNRQEGLQLMDRANPMIIPRNHLVEQALDKANQGDLSSFETLLNRLTNPYNDQSDKIVHELDLVPAGYDMNYKTFCGT